MKKIILLFAVLGGIILSHAYTSSYKCIDRKDKYELWINIDQNSLHFRDSNKTFLFNYDKTVYAKDKDNILIHIFSANNYEQLVYQSKTNPIEIYVDDYKDNKLRYEYECKLKDVLEDQNGIPITWRSIKDKEKMLKKAAKPVPKPKIVNNNVDRQNFYEDNLDTYAFCAANYFVRTITPKKQKTLSKIIQSYGMTSQYIGSLYFSKLYKKTASKGTMFKYREKHLLSLEKEFRDNKKLSKESLQKIAQCDGKIIYLSNNPSVYNDINKNFVYSDESNKLFLNELAITSQKPAKIDEKRVLESFRVWIDDHDGMTPSKMIRTLKEKENK